MSNPEEIDAVYRHLVASPSDARAWVRLGALQLRAGRREAALEAFNRARQLAPMAVEACAGYDRASGHGARSTMRLGILHEAAGRTEVALAAYQAAAEITPGDSFVLRALHRLGMRVEETAARLARNLQRLQSDDPEVRRAAVAALGALGSPQATGALLERLGDPDLTVRREAAAALGAIGDVRAGGGLLEALQKPWEAAYSPEVASALTQVAGPELVDELLRLLDHPERQVVTACVRALGKCGERRAAGPLLGRLQEADTPWACELLEALAELGDAESVPAARAFCEAQDGRTRRAAYWLLGRHGGVQAAPRLIQALQDPWPPAAETAAEGLRQLLELAPEPLADCIREALREAINQNLRGPVPPPDASANGA